MRRLEVRCCCQPRKLLGTLPVMDSQIDKDQVIFPLGKPRTYEPPSRETRLTMPRSTVLGIADFQTEVDGRLVITRAIKAEGIPIETLRLIPGFIEHHEGESP